MKKNKLFPLMFMLFQMGSAFAQPLSSSPFANRFTIGDVNNLLSNVDALKYLHTTDLDNDNKIDVISTRIVGSTPFLIIWQNGLSLGSLTNYNFTEYKRMLLGKPSMFRTADIDNDGYTDIVVSYSGTPFISVFRNTSTVSAISFATRIDIATNNTSSSGIFNLALDIADLNADGKLDIALVNSDTNTTNNITLFRNTSSATNISFAAPVHRKINAHPTQTNQVSSFLKLTDINFDGKPDIIIKNDNSNYITIAENNTTSASSIFLFTSGSNFTVGSASTSRVKQLAIGDINGDKKSDIIFSTDDTPDKIEILKNFSTGVGLVSFISQYSFTTGAPIHGIALGDIDGDKKTDIIFNTYPNTTGRIAFVQNLSNNISILFGSPIDVQTGNSGGTKYQAGLGFTDLNQNDAPEIVTIVQDTTSGSYTIIGFNNTLSARIIPVLEENVYGMYPQYAFREFCKAFLLFDEQEKDTPRTYINSPYTDTANYTPLSDDHRAKYSVVIDLVDSYTLSAMEFYNSNLGGGGLLNVEIGTPQVWTSITGGNFNVKTFHTDTALLPPWQDNWLTYTFTNSPITRFIRLTFTEIPPLPYLTRIKEIRFKGTKQSVSAPVAISTAIPNKPKVGDLMGVTGAFGISNKLLSCATSLRQFHSWQYNDGGEAYTYPYLHALDTNYTGGLYKWAPDYGSRNLDVDLTEKVSNGGLKVYPVLQQTAYYMEKKLRSAKRKPLDSSTANHENPGSYTWHAKYMFQFAARYGATALPLSQIVVAPAQTPKTGLNQIKYIENWNEQNDWYSTEAEGYVLNKNIFFSPFEFAAMSSADIDGHNGTLPGLTGAKRADSTMKVVMGGLVSLDLDYVKGMKLWADYNRTGSSSSAKFPSDVLNFHNYSNATGFVQPTVGISPEDDRLKERLKAIVDYRNKYLPGKEIWLSEFGYDTYQGSEMRVPSVSGNNVVTDVLEVHGRWTLRSFLEIAASGIDKAQYYGIQDEIGFKAKHGSSGLVENDSTKNTPKPAWYYVKIMKDLVKDFTFEAEIAADNPIIDPAFAQYMAEGTISVYKFRSQSKQEDIYAVWCRTSDNRVVQNFAMHLSLNSNQTYRIVEPNIGGGRTDGCNHVPTILNVTEMPKFIHVVSKTAFPSISYTGQVAHLQNVNARVSGNITIPAGDTLYITNSDLEMDGDYEIIVNGKLVLNNTRVARSCWKWKGIKVNSGGEIKVLNNSIIQHAYVGIYTHNSNSVTISDSKFYYSQIAILLNNAATAINQNLIENNEFYECEEANGIGAHYPSSDTRFTYQAYNAYVFLDEAEQTVVRNNRFMGEDVYICPGCNPSNIVGVYVKNTSHISINNNDFIAGPRQQIDCGVYLDGFNNFNAEHDTIYSNNFTHTKTGIRIVDIRKYNIRYNKFVLNDIGIEAYNSDYSNAAAYYANSGFYFPVKVISYNTFRNCDKGIIVAPKMNPFSANADWNNNALQPNDKHYMAITCNEFNNVTYGISGVGLINDQLKNPTGSSGNGAETTTNNIFRHPNDSVQWDIVWHTNSTGHWNYFVNPANLFSCPGSNYYFPNCTNTGGSPVSYPILGNPVQLNGVSVSMSGNALTNPDHIDNQFLTDVRPDQTDTTIQAGALCYQDPFSQYLDGSVWGSPERNLLTTSVVPAEKNKIANMISLYPNPASQSIAVKGLDQNYTCIIYSSSGTFVQQVILNKNSSHIDLKTFSPGVYYIKMQSLQGETVYKRFVKIN